MIDPFGEKRGQFQYGAILSRLNKIRENIEAAYDEEEEEAEAGAGAEAGKGKQNEAISSSESLKSSGLT